MANTNSKEETVASISALIRKRTRELTKIEGSIGEKKSTAARLRATISGLKNSLKKANEDKKRKGFVSLAGKWYLNEANSNKLSKDYVFVKEDLGYVTATGWLTVYRKLLIDVLTIEKLSTEGNSRTVKMSFSANKGYSYFSNPNLLKPIEAEEIEEEIRKQYIRFANRTEDHGLNLYWDFSRRTK